MNLRDVCGELSISYATGKNWVKLGKLIPEKTEKGVPYFSANYIEKLKGEIASGKNKALKSRRNKRFISGNGMYNSYVSDSCAGKRAVDSLLALIEGKELSLTPEIVGWILGACAVKFFAGEAGASFEAYLKGELRFSAYDTLIDELVFAPTFTSDGNQKHQSEMRLTSVDRARALSFVSENPDLFDIDFEYEESEDVLGLLYISCKNLGNRKAKGSYYTPSAIVKKMTTSEFLQLKKDSVILDPCCGTGNFLLQLPDTVGIENIYGCDIDPISVAITRINMALKFPTASVEQISSHIIEADYLIWQEQTICREIDNCEEENNYSNHYSNLEEKTGRFPTIRPTHIIGNPPWGYEFSALERSELKRRYRTASKKSFDSFDVFTEKALMDLEKGGVLAFVLPKAILNVKSHETIRKIILERTSIESIEYLGDAFHKVNCPSVIMKIRNAGKELTTKGLTINDGERQFTINTKRPITAGTFSFLTTDEEYRIIEKIKNVRDARFLLDNADFALGIVTGNNAEYISGEKNSDNEMVLRGSDIFKYSYRNSDSFIIFKPDSFQQVAPTALYRAKEKLLYRFISSQLVFAYDDRQTLSLNSCNVLIPRIPGLEVKYILAILNSRVSQFFYQKQFDSVKILRAHIESIPIPYVDSVVQKKIIDYVDRLIAACGSKSQADAGAHGTADALYNRLDELIFDIYALDEKERILIRTTVDKSNRFLHP